MSYRRSHPQRVLQLCLLVGLSLVVPSTAAPAPSTRAVDILTFHNDVARTGWNALERVLTPATVRSGFGKLWTASVEGEIYAEPLLAGGVSVGGTPSTVLYVVTSADFVYAFDAARGERVWGPVSLGTPVSRATLPCGNIDPVGITSTPVIDRASSTLYIAGLTTPDDGRTKVYKIGALDLSSGAMRTGWPVVIAPPAVSGLRFDPSVQQQRGALTLLHDVVYVPFGGYWGDCGAYHGWVVGVPISRPDQQQAFVTPTRREGGIWATGGVAADAEGNLYAATGNSDSEGPVDYGNSVVRLATKPTLNFSGNVSDFFTPSNFVMLNETDADLGSAVPVVLPPLADSTTPNLVFVAGKQGVGYLINRANMGGVGRGDGVNGEGVYSRCVFGTCGRGEPKVFSALAYWDGGATGRMVLVPGHGSQPTPCRGSGGVAALRLEVASGTRTAAFGLAWCSVSMRDPGAPAVTSAGAEDALVWVIDTASGVLYALSARTGETIYHSTGQDTPGSVHRFITPAVADGHVYVGAARALVAYGLK